MKNLDTSVTVLPGLTVNPDQSFTLDFSGISNGSGNHDGITFQLSASLFAGSRRASVSGVAVVPGQSVVTLDSGIPFIL